MKFHKNPLQTRKDKESQTYKEMCIKAQALPPGIHLFVKIGKLEVPYLFMSLKLILMKLHIFTKPGMINRAVWFILLFE